MKRAMLLCLFAVLSTVVNGEIVNVKFETSVGDIALELYPDDAPITVDNFLKYVNDGFYDGQIIHRVIPDFIIQGGLFDQDLNYITPAYDPIINESYNGLSNLRGTLAMGRTYLPNSATSSFYINLVDNAFLDRTYLEAGYCVFGRVIDGMDVVDAIAVTPTIDMSGTNGNLANLPYNPTVDIYRAYVVPEPTTLSLLALGGLLLRRRKKA